MKKLGLLLITTFFIACNSDNEKNDANQANYVFVSTTWKKSGYTKYVYDRNILDTVIVDTLNRNVETLKFNNDYSVIYFNPDFGSPLVGNWSPNFEEDKIYTNLKRETPSGTEYFFPKNKVYVVEFTSLEVVSDTIFVYDESGEIESKSFTKYFFKQ